MLVTPSSFGGKPGSLSETPEKESGEKLEEEGGQEGKGDSVTPEKDEKSEGEQSEGNIQPSV